MVYFTFFLKIANQPTEPPENLLTKDNQRIIQISCMRDHRLLYYYHHLTECAKLTTTTTTTIRKFSAKSTVYSLNLY